MQIYLASIYPGGYMKDQSQYDKFTDFEKSIVDNLPNILESYHYVNKQKYVDDMRRNNSQVFLDSGAFSAFTLGAEIDLPTYCNYIKKNTDIIRKDDGLLMASVLDGIGDPLRTWQNQKQMESLGVRPLPCFHFGEDERYLEYYINNYEYITIGGMVPYSTKQLFIWLDRIWNRYLIDGSGNPKVKVHGFGLTSVPLMKSYPWYSVDSSRWIQAAVFGYILVNDKPIEISDKSGKRKTKGAHLETITEIEKNELVKQLTEWGFDVESLAKNSYSRAIYNMWSFIRTNDQINKTTTRRTEIQYLF